MATAAEESDVFVNSSTIGLNMESILLNNRNPARRSSMVSDTNRRRNSRKKTVSFSSMPNERKVITGKTFMCELIDLKIAGCYVACKGVSSCNPGERGQLYTFFDFTILKLLRHEEKVELPCWMSTF